jgi:hypothetical protein
LPRHEASLAAIHNGSRLVSLSDRQFARAFGDRGNFRFNLGAQFSRRHNRGVARLLAQIAPHRSDIIAVMPGRHRRVGMRCG